MGTAARAAKAPTEEAQLAEQLVTALRHHELVVPILDALHHLGILGVGLHRLGFGLELVLGDPHTLGRAPQLGRVEQGEAPDDLIGLRARREVARRDPHPASSRTRIEARSRQHIDLAFAVGEEPGDVLGLLDIDHPMATAGGPEDREATSAIGGQLRVHPRSATAESTHELVDETLSFEASHPRDHGQSWVEFHAEIVVVCFDD